MLGNEYILIIEVHKSFTCLPLSWYKTQALCPIGTIHKSFGIVPVDNIRAIINGIPADTTANMVRVEKDWSNAIERISECHIGRKEEMFFVKSILYLRMRFMTFRMTILVLRVGEEGRSTNLKLLP